MNGCRAKIPQIDGWFIYLMSPTMCSPMETLQHELSVIQRMLLFLEWPFHITILNKNVHDSPRFGSNKTFLAFSHQIDWEDNTRFGWREITRHFSQKCGVLSIFVPKIAGRQS